MRHITKLFAGLCCLFAASPAAAQTSNGPGWFYVPKITGFFAASTLGAGAGLGFHDPGSAFGVRASFNLFRFGINFTQQGSKSRAQANLQNESIIADIYPTRRNFHISAGVVFNQNSAHYSSTPELTGALLGFVRRTHYTGVIGDVHGPISFNPVAPYLGIGYSADNGRNWTFNADVGAMYQGNGRIALTPTGLVASNPQMRAQVTANAYRANRMLNKMSVYPIVSLQIGYHF